MLHTSPGKCRPIFYPRFYFTLPRPLVKCLYPKNYQPKHTLKLMFKENKFTLKNFVYLNLSSFPIMVGIGSKSDNLTSMDCKEDSELESTPTLVDIMFILPLIHMIGLLSYTTLVPGLPKNNISKYWLSWSVMIQMKTCYNINSNLLHSLFLLPSSFMFNCCWVGASQPSQHLFSHQDVFLSSWVEQVLRRG